MQRAESLTVKGHKANEAKASAKRPAIPAMPMPETPAKSADSAETFVANNPQKRPATTPTTMRRRLRAKTTPTSQPGSQAQATFPGDVARRRPSVDLTVDPKTAKCEAPESQPQRTGYVAWLFVDTVDPKTAKFVTPKKACHTVPVTVERLDHDTVCSLIDSLPDTVTHVMVHKHLLEDRVHDITTANQRFEEVEGRSLYIEDQVMQIKKQYEDRIHEISIANERFQEVKARTIYLEDKVHKLRLRTYALEKILDCVMPRIGLYNFQMILQAAGFVTENWMSRGAWVDSTLPYTSRS